MGREVGGCNPTTLTQRLNRLESLQLLSREDQSARYELTDSGRALEMVIGAIDVWAGMHLEVNGAKGDREKLRRADTLSELVSS